MIHPKTVLIVTIIALTALRSVYAVTIDPFAQAEVTYTDSGLKDSTSVYGFGLDGYEAGMGLTLGVFVQQRHEVSVGTGLTEWTGTPVVTPGFVRVESKIEQMPVLLNYRYHLPLDTKGRYTIFIGPSVGYIREKITITDHQLGGLPPALVGSDSQTDWKFAYGATIGINAKLGAHWITGASAQVLTVESSDFTTFGGAGPYGHFDRATRPSFTLSLGYTW